MHGTNVAELDYKQIVNILEQLECLLSEDTSRRPMITNTIDSNWIPSQNKTSRS